MTYDFCVIGGGIVGLASARALLAARPGASLLLLEKEDGFARHQTGHNSGVIHAGVYYAPGSLKAKLCFAGNRATKAFCREHGVAYEDCGKLIVATSALEVERLKALEARSVRNGLTFERLSAAGLREREPNVAGLAGLFFPATGMVDYRIVAEAMAGELRRAGAEIRTGEAVASLAEGAGEVAVGTGAGSYRARKLVVCGGLQSDRLARLAGLDVDYRIIPFRGEYYVLPAARSGIVRHHIYPVPDPELPFLGVHLTRMIDGRVTLGPNAVLGFAREGYSRFSLAPRDMADFAAFPGFWKMLKKYWRSAAGEGRRSLSRRAYLEACRRYCPSLELSDLTPYPAGIRAQAVLADGSLVQDFLFKETERSLHVCNAPSPAATSAIPIGEMIAERLLARTDAGAKASA